MWGPENIWLVAFCGAMAFIANLLYSMGGTTLGKRGYLVLRRYGSSFILAVAVNVCALVLQKWAWQYLLVFPCLIGGFSLGYSATTTAGKIIRRSIFALGVLTASILCFWLSGWANAGWGIIAAQLFFAGWSVYFAIKNPWWPTVEQFIICGLLTFFLPFWPFIG